MFPDVPRRSQPGPWHGQGWLLPVSRVPAEAAVQEGLLAAAGTGLLREKTASGELGLSLGEAQGSSRGQEKQGKTGMDGEKMGIK